MLRVAKRSNHTNLYITKLAIKAIKSSEFVAQAELFISMQEQNGFM